MMVVVPGVLGATAPDSTQRREEGSKPGRVRTLMVGVSGLLGQTSLPCPQGVLSGVKHKTQGL